MRGAISASLHRRPFFGIFACSSPFPNRIMTGSESTPLGQEDQDDEVATHEPAKVILFNDEVHTFDEVITQLIKAIRCSREKAESLAWEVHTNGRAAVYAGELPRCIEVSGILEEIQLMTQIEV
jgi:ATP-dependent Clp protease adaptor protein ClpS